MLLGTIPRLLAKEWLFLSQPHGSVGWARGGPSSARVCLGSTAIGGTRLDFFLSNADPNAALPRGAGGGG